MACTSSKTLDSLVPQEAKSALLENAISGSALWSLQKNPGIGIHFTLFWPTDVPAEDLLEVQKLSGEEKKLVTQSPGLLSFILKKKKEELSKIETEKIGNKRARSESPKNESEAEIEENEEPPAKKTFSNDSGTSSPTEKIQKVIFEEQKTEFSEEIKKEGQFCSESASEKAEEIQTEISHAPAAFVYPSLSGFQSPLASPSLHPSTLIQNIQNQIFQAAIHRRKLLEDEQKRILSGFQTSGAATAFNPSSAQNLNQQRAPMPMQLAIPPNPLSILGNNAARFQMPPTSFAGLTHSDIGLPREGEAVFRDKYIWSESVKKYLCSVCGYSTPYRSNIIVHLPKHYPELRRFRCPICSKRYGRKDLWKSHLRSRHPEIADIILSPTWHSAQPNHQALKSGAKQADVLTTTKT